MILYLDTSSLVKLYVEEEGSAEVRQLVEAATVVATSVIAYAEARAGLARHRREKALTASGLERAKAGLERDWPALLKLNITESVYRHTGDLAERHGLRGFDSLHLASFLSLHPPGGAVEPIMFSSYDEKLNRAARSEAR